MELIAENCTENREVNLLFTALNNFPFPIKDKTHMRIKRGREERDESK